MRRKGIVLAVAAVLALLVLTSCAGANPDIGIPTASGDIAGFWAGLWNGLTSLPAFIVGRFNDNVGVYEVHNNGGWYDFGFLLGAGTLAGTLAGGGGTTYVIVRRNPN